MRAIIVMIVALLGFAAPALADALKLVVARAEEGTPMFGAAHRIDVALDGASMDAFALYTAARAGRTIYMYVEGHLILSPLLQTAITNGRITLNAGPGGFNGRPATDVLSYLNTGGTIEVTDRPR